MESGLWSVQVAVEIGDGIRVRGRLLESEMRGVGKTRGPAVDR